MTVQLYPHQRVGVLAAATHLRDGGRGWYFAHDPGYRWRLEKRMWAKVRVGEPDECWPWLGAKTIHGYGLIGVGPRVENTAPVDRVTRVMWALYVDPNIQDLDLLHRCDNPPCVNLTHLWAGTAKENHDDSVTKGRHVPPPRKIGEGNPSTKLTASDVVLIRFRREQGETYISIAQDYGVDWSNIQRICTRKTWQHVP